MTKILFIGGTGIISSECSKAAISKGYEVYHLTRGKSCQLRPVKGVTNITCDIRADTKRVKEVLKDHHFDAVVDWVAFTTDHILSDIDIFKGKCDQFIFISSASAYQTPPESLPVTEDTPLYNPFWEYSRNKIACENILQEELKNNGFPFTIVRPSHTYDRTLLPFEGGYTVFDRIKRGKKVVIHGDGSSVWTLTHSKDFAQGFAGLLGRKEAIGETYHITSDHWLSWFQIYKTFADAIGTELNTHFVPSHIIAQYNKDMGDSLLGDKTHSMIFDNSKIKALVPEFKAQIPLSQGAGEIIDFYNDNPQMCVVDENLNKMFDRIIENT
ncbi:NAD-dependent epimerase/dehydratase family protein [Chitinispirillales bacterium ANBcel5]|uniref:NAD-dependent epimerase/dehydratase family protein n=1 Tax=Cellulosispirillum alkaliphilum TaxID=3039283 RepID=UPI002A55C90C|nr:NAD-dependent epimerase/dehydratase family protein [Chitinispirillales bacterium ANBcel5]